MSTFKTRLDNLRHTEFLAVTQQEFGLTLPAASPGVWTGQVSAAPLTFAPVATPTVPIFRGTPVWRVPARLVAAPAASVPDTSAPFFADEPEWNRPLSAPARAESPQAPPLQAASAPTPNAPTPNVPTPDAPLVSAPTPSAPVLVPPIPEVPFSSPTQTETAPSVELSATSEPSYFTPEAAAETPQTLPVAEAPADATLSPQEPLTRAEMINPAMNPALLPATEAQEAPAGADAPARISPRRATFREVMALNDLSSAQPEATPVRQAGAAAELAVPPVPRPQADATTPVAPIPAEALQDAAPLLAAALAPPASAVVDAASPEVQLQSAAVPDAAPALPTNADATPSTPSNTALSNTAPTAQEPAPMPQRQAEARDTDPVLINPVQINGVQADAAPVSAPASPLSSAPAAALLDQAVSVDQTVAQAPQTPTSAALTPAEEAAVAQPPAAELATPVPVQQDRAEGEQAEAEATPPNTHTADTQTADEAAASEPAAQRMGADELKAIEAIMRGGDQEIGVILPRRPRPTRRPGPEGEAATPAPRTPTTPAFEELAHAEVMSVFERLNRVADADAEGSTETRMLTFEELTTGQLRRAPTAPTPSKEAPALPSVLPNAAAPATASVPSAALGQGAPNSAGRFRATARPRAEGQTAAKPAAAPSPSPAAAGQTPREPQARSQTADQTDEEGHSKESRQSKEIQSSATLLLRAEAASVPPEGVPPEVSATGAAAEARRDAPQAGNRGLALREPSATGTESAGPSEAAEPQLVSSGLLPLDEQREPVFAPPLPELNLPELNVTADELQPEDVPALGLPTVQVFSEADQPVPAQPVTNQPISDQRGAPEDVPQAPAFLATGALPPQLAPLQGAPELASSAALLDLATQPRPTARDLEHEAVTEQRPEVVTAVAEARAVSAEPVNSEPRRGQPVTGLPLTVLPEAQPDTALPDIVRPNIAPPLVASVFPEPVRPAVVRAVAVERPRMAENPSPVPVPTLPFALAAALAGAEEETIVQNIPVVQASTPTPDDAAQQLAQAVRGVAAAPTFFLPVGTQQARSAEVEAGFSVAAPEEASPTSALLPATTPLLDRSLRTPQLPALGLQLDAQPRSAVAAGPTPETNVAAPTNFLSIKPLPSNSIPAGFTQAREVEVRGFGTPPLVQSLADLSTGSPAPSTAPANVPPRPTAPQSTTAFPPLAALPVHFLPNAAAPHSGPSFPTLQRQASPLEAVAAQTDDQIRTSGQAVTPEAPLNTVRLNAMGREEGGQEARLDPQFQFPERGVQLPQFQPSDQTFPGSAAAQARLPALSLPIQGFSALGVSALNAAFAAVPLSLPTPYTSGPLALSVASPALPNLFSLPSFAPSPDRSGPLALNLPVTSALVQAGQFTPQQALQQALRQAVGGNLSLPQPPPVNGERALVAQGAADSPLSTAPSVPFLPVPMLAAPAFSVLAPSVQSQMANALGVRVNDIQVVQHAGTQAILNQHRAEALTVGDTVILGPNLDLRSPAGLGVLAHELTHALRARKPDFVPRLVQGAPNATGEEGLALQVEGAVRASARAQGQPSLQNRTFDWPSAVRANPVGASPFANSAPPPRNRPVSAAPPRATPMESTPFAAADAPAFNDASVVNTAGPTRLPAPWEPMPFWEDSSSGKQASAAAPAFQAPAAPPPVVTGPVPVYAASSDRQVSEPAPFLPAPSAAPSPAPASPPSSSTPATATSRQPSKAQQANLDELAQQVYSVLKRRLANESRRRT